MTFNSHGVTLKIKKCLLSKREVDYLGHVIKKGKREIDGRITDKIKFLKKPRTVT